MTEYSGGRVRKGKRRFARWIVLAALLFIASGLVESLFPRVTRTAIPLSTPDPVKIVVLSDPHLSPWRPTYPFLRLIVERANDQHPDLILLLGDYINARPSIPDAAKILGKLHAPLGIYAVLGNHDRATDAPLMAHALRAEGVHVLVNAQSLVRTGHTILCLDGIDDWTRGKPDLSILSLPAPAGSLRILLSHNPDVVLNPRAQRADLILSGHTHGGQVWLLGPFIAPVSAWGRHHLSGLYQKGHPWVFVTRGVNLGRAPPRWYCAPEISILTLGPRDTPRPRT